MNAPVLVVDLEATCSEDMTGWDMETTEIGACVVRDGAVLACFQTFVRPVVNPRLTAFCTALTGISQSDVDSAPLFPVAAELLRQFVELHQEPGSSWASWGAYDRTQLTRDALRSGVAEPITLPHVNLKQLFAKQQRIGKQVGATRALTLANLAFEGIHHRALDDARNIAKLLPYAFGEKLLRTQHQSRQVAP
ncbi:MULTISPECIES: exonuclease domain-containing protein [Cupriavidus]|uniref:exonuclease domain-containing protein n=1 Tax=Cupriavidus TaxID=106589 RepID=UPI0035C6E5D6